MKLSDISGLLTGTVSPLQFTSVCQADFEERLQRIGKKGSVIPVRVNEDAHLSISQAEVAVLCRLFTAGDLTAVQLAYIADALQLSDQVTFSGPDVADYIEEFTDPEINGVFTRARAEEIVSSVTSST